MRIEDARVANRVCATERGKVAQKILKAKEFIKDPEHWCRGSLGLDKDGIPVAGDHERAVARCALGALQAVGVYSHNWQNSKEVRFLSLAAQSLGYLLPTSHPNCVANFNNHNSRGHAGVMEMFDIAAGMAEELDCN